MSYAFPDTDFDRAGSHAEQASFDAADQFMTRDRESITSEPEPNGTGHDPRYPDCDWLGTVNMGGGAVPSDLEWRSNPRGDRLPDRDSN